MRVWGDYFFTPWYSSTVLVEMVVVVLAESADWTQVAVVEIVRQALQEVAQNMTLSRINNADRNFLILYVVFKKVQQ